MSEVDILKAKLKNLCDAAEMVNLEFHGRKDCKCCALLEEIREKILGEEA